MQRPIPATRSLPYREAQTAFRHARETLIRRGLTRKPYEMCAMVGKYGQGWAVFVGFQDSTNLPKALRALEENARKPGNRAMTWVFSPLTHSMCAPPGCAPLGVCRC